MANVGTNFQWRKCQWLTSEQTSSEKKFLDIRGALGTTWPSWVIASHSDITQKNISRKKFLDIRGTPGTTWPSWVIASHSDITQKHIPRKKIFWTFEALLALPDHPESLPNILASLKEHFGITQKHFTKKKFGAKKIKKILIVVIFERYAQTNRQTDKLVVYINDLNFRTIIIHPQLSTYARISIRMALIWKAMTQLATIFESFNLSFTSIESQLTISIEFSSFHVLNSEIDSVQQNLHLH
jgi:hypothetical protein